jgi:hypothetical protein
LAEVGVVVQFETGAVGIANVADELTVLAWPSPTWTAIGVGDQPP